MKTANIAIVGRTNVGKSTLMNALIGEKVAIVSDKPQTTRSQIIGIYNDDDYQIVFIDTPGLHDPKNKLGNHMMKATNEALDDVDAVLLVAECRMPGKTELNLIEKLKKTELPIILVLNKIDLIGRDEILSVISRYSELCEFTSIVPISARQSDGVKIVFDEIVKFAENGEPVFPDDIATNMSMRDLTSEIIREKFLNLLRDEIPHGIAVDIVAFRETQTKAGEPLCDIAVDIICEREAHKGIIIGKGGDMLKQAVSAARHDLEEMFDTKVFLQCFVKVRENWRDNEELIKSFGFQ